MYLKTADDPPSLTVGTAVSAKYKGAFCEAKVNKVVRIVKCKVTFKKGLGTATVSDDAIQGPIRMGQTVQVKHPDKKELVEATIGKIQDCSQYTVVFDDGDITTLRRTALCLKSGRHFNESETLDQLPLTHPEHFGNPVVGGRRGRRNRQFEEDSSEGEAEEENEPDLEGYTTDIGRVVSVETTDKKRGRDNWFPGLVVIPSAQPTVRINVKDEYLIRSFKDGRYYTVPKKEVLEFSREMGEKAESLVLIEAVSKTLKYLDQNELPIHWERNSLFNMQAIDTDSEDNYSDSSDDGPNEEKDRFVAQLYKFMDEAGTPLNKSPIIANKDVDLHRLFRVVHKMGGCNRVTNQNKWRTVSTRLKLPLNQIIFNQVKSVYKKCLLSYESFYRTLGVTMLNHTRTTKKNRGRSLIRDKDRSTPVSVTSSPKPEKEKEDEVEVEIKEEERIVPVEVKKKIDVIIKTPKEEEKKKIFEQNSENSNSSSDATDFSEPTPSTSREVGRPRRLDKGKDKKVAKPLFIEKIKQEPPKKEDDDKEKEKTPQQTRSKTQTPKAKEPKTIESPKIQAQKTPSLKKPEDEKKRGRKRLNTEEKTPETLPEVAPVPAISLGDKLKVYYGPTHESKVTYEAKVIEIDKDATGPVYRVHYTGWNTRYDEWINPNRIAENLSAATKAKKLKQGGNGGSGGNKTSGKMAGKRGRGMSITGRSTVETPRSTTPSSVTSSSSRTKSPATPATRSTSRLTRQDYGRKTRRSSAQTDNSNHSESDSDISDSEFELTRTRSGNRSEEIELKTYKKKPAKTPTKSDKSKDKEGDDDGDKEEESDTSNRPKRLKKLKKTAEKSPPDDSDEEIGINPPKGRDFDLNQIRLELKGITKVKTTLEAADKEVLSSSDDSTNTQINVKAEPDEKKDFKSIESEKASSSEDIYEFKEPEPFEFETRPKMIDEKSCKKRIPRLFEELDKSPKKTAKSPVKLEKSSPESEKNFRKTPLRQSEDDSDDDDIKLDLFDKLVESPSFNLIKSGAEKSNQENKTKVTKNLDALKFFGDFPDPTDDFNRDIDFSDGENQPIFSRNEELFAESFNKENLGALDVEFSTKSDENKKEDEFESIRESIARAIQRTPSSDEYDNVSDDNLMITPSVSSYLRKKRDVDSSIIKPDEESKQESFTDKIKEELATQKLAKISPVKDESSSVDFLKTISSISGVKSVEESKESIKTGSKIADSILQKFSSIKNKTGDDDVKTELDPVPEMKPLEPIKKIIELKVKPSEIEKKSIIVSPKIDTSPQTEAKKRGRITSKTYIDESDADSTDSEQLVIARSDEDSHTNSDKPDLKESDSNLSVPPTLTTDESQEVPEKPAPATRNFKFDTIEEKKAEILEKQPPEIEKEQQIEAKEDEPDSQLHSLLLCEETIPRSPAPAGETSTGGEIKPKSSSIVAVAEMPFASAPGSSNNKNMLLNNDHKPIVKPQAPVLVMPAVGAPLGNRDNPGPNTVLDNTPPTTPESSISNLSPPREVEDLSPNVGENESCRSNDAEPEFPRKRRSSSLNKLPNYSEEDSQMTNEPTSAKKSREESTVPVVCRKRRKSARAEDTPAKRGRKPLNRSRHNSDSDDTSEHSMSGATTSLVAAYQQDRTPKSPRPSKYNFFVEFDPSLNSSQRISVLQQKLSELRKTYAEVKTELAAVERRRKKIRRREREALKASKQEMVCG